MTILSLAWIPAPAGAQTLIDRSCTGKSDIPAGQQILGCSDAIKSGAFAGKDLAAAFGNRGSAYLDKGELDRAIADYDQAITIDATSAVSFYGRAAAYFAKKQNDNAIDDLTRSLALDPNFAVAYNGRGNAYAAKGDIDHAIADFDLR